jgi:type IV secretion system protein VirB3
MRAERGVTADVLFLGVTRPALALGVPYSALLANALLTLELFLVTRNLVWLLLGLPLHGLAWLVCLAEPRFFDLLAVRLRVRSAAGLAPGQRFVARSYGSFAHHGSGSGRLPPVAVVESRELAR